MKTLLLILLLSPFMGFSQSFYHKKMKKVKSIENLESCKALKPKHTSKQSLNQKSLYTHKRRKARRN